MMPLESLVHTPFASALGWTIFHSLWEGLIVAAALSLLLCATRSARVRYLAACFAMIVILLASAVTLIRMMPEPPRVFVTTIAQHIPARAIEPTSAAISRHFALTEIVPWLTPLWIVGVVLFNLRAGASWLAARRLRTKGVCLAPEDWQRRAQELAEHLGLAKAALLLESSLAAGPAVVGFIRPVILTPVGMLAGMPTTQVESILLHELAHIRRRDYLANLLQTVVEGLLFYHPAIWWISHVVRTERENCCDDLVVSASGNAPDYAAALSALAETRLAAVVLPATGGSLMRRIRRLLYPEQTSPSFLMPLLSATVFTLVTAWAATAWQAPVEARKPAAAPPINRFDRVQQPAQLAPRQIAQVQQAAPAAARVAEPAAGQQANPPEEKIMEMYVNGELRRYRAVRLQMKDGRIWWGINERDRLIAQNQTPPNVLRVGHFEEADRQAREQEIKGKLDTPYAKWLNQDVTYIITDAERAAFRRLQTDDERKQFIQQFWVRRDPTPGTPLNEMQQEHYRRIDYANSRFSSASGIPGWKTDRGRIYITFGPPNELDSHPSGANGKPPFEVWLYRWIEGIGNDVNIEFVDPSGNGEYQMARDPNATTPVQAPQPQDTPLLQ